MVIRKIRKLAGPVTRLEVTNRVSAHSTTFLPPALSLDFDSDNHHGLDLGKLYIHCLSLQVLPQDYQFSLQHLIPSVSAF